VYTSVYPFISIGYANHAHLVHLDFPQTISSWVAGYIPHLPSGSVRNHMSKKVPVGLVHNLLLSDHCLEILTAALAAGLEALQCRITPIM
jgi:hypothetical protein